MDFNEYQKKARETAVYPDVGKNMWYPALGLAGEVGEVMEIIKKTYRDNGGELLVVDQVRLRKELGDVLWYIANLCWETDIDLAQVARENYLKLQDRLTRNVIHGSGDNR